MDNNQNEVKVNSSYKVKTNIFEGPFELLLSLIENRKLFVNELSLTEVTEDFIKYIKTLPDLEISQASEFIVVAATLILIKSRSLLPNLSLTTDEQEKIVDLEARLKIYALISESARELRKVFGKEPHFIIKERNIGAGEVIFVPDARITVASMHELAKGLLDKLPKKEEKMPEVAVRKVISIEEMIDELTTRITANLETNFSAFLRSSGATLADVEEKRTHVIVSFLAMLELVREGIIDVVQEMSDDDIAIYKRDEQFKGTLTHE